MVSGEIRPSTLGHVKVVKGQDLRWDFIGYIDIAVIENL